MEINDVEIWFGAKDMIDNEIKEKKMKIVGEVTQEPNPFDADKKNYILHCLDDASGLNYKIRMNLSSATNIVKALGKDTKNWIGKDVSMIVKEIRGKNSLILSVV